MPKAIAATSLAALLALAVTLPAEQAGAMSRPKKEEKPAAADSQAQPATKNPFFWLGNISGWNSIDDKHIVVYGGRSQAALVTLFASCQSLSYAETIAIEAPVGYLDRGGLGTVIYRETGSSFPRRCPIDTLDSVKDLTEAKALVESRKAQKEMEKSGSASPTN